MPESGRVPEPGTFRYEVDRLVRVLEKLLPVEGILFVDGSDSQQLRGE